jgi:hypothetical protein
MTATFFCWSAMASLLQPSGHLRAIEKRADYLGNLVAVRFEGEMARVEELDLRIWHVALERLGARRQEEWVVLAPGRKGGLCVRKYV